MIKQSPTHFKVELTDSIVRFQYLCSACVQQLCCIGRFSSVNFRCFAEVLPEQITEDVFCNGWGLRVIVGLLQSWIKVADCTSANAGCTVLYPGGVGDRRFVVPGTSGSARSQRDSIVNSCAVDCAVNCPNLPQIGNARPRKWVRSRQPAGNVGE